MSYDMKHLQKFFKENGFKPIRTNGKHEIYHDGYSSIPMPRSKSLGFRDCKNVMNHVKKAVRRREEILAKEGAEYLKQEEPMKTTVGEVWPKIVKSEEKIVETKDLKEVVTGLVGQGKGWGEIATILNHMGFKGLNGKPFIPLSARKAAERFGLAESSAPWSKKNLERQRETPPAPKERRAYATSGERDAEITIKILENVLTTPDLKASIKLEMIKRLIG